MLLSQAALTRRAHFVLLWMWVVGIDAVILSLFAIITFLSRRHDMWGLLLLILITWQTTVLFLLDALTRHFVCLISFTVFQLFDHTGVAFLLKCRRHNSVGSSWLLRLQEIASYAMQGGVSRRILLASLWYLATMSQHLADVRQFRITWRNPVGVVSRGLAPYSGMGDCLRGRSYLRYFRRIFFNSVRLVR